MIGEKILFILYYLIPALCIAILSWGIFEYIRKYLKGYLMLALPPALAIILLLVISLSNILFPHSGTRQIISPFVFFFIPAMALLVIMTYLGDRNILRSFPPFVVFIMFFFTIYLVITHFMLRDTQISSFFWFFLSPESTVLTAFLETLSNMIMFLISLIYAALMVFPMVYLEKNVREMREPQ